MGTIINLLCITVILVFIIDISGVMTHIKEWISLLLTKGKIRKSNYSLKPFDCSLCSTFWVGIIYLLCVGRFTIPYLLVVALLAMSALTIKNLLLLILDSIDTLIAKLNKLL